ncbi:hypothetical protein, partial [Klebsiella aerogenes]|uniref:hypothetical protein n=1 Tax=Klebsiella aerogenes TaxID=548 RepID=UPI001953305D
ATSSSIALAMGSGVWYPLTVGRNVLSYYVRDMDEVCAPVLLEMQELWAVQALLLEPVTSLE